MVGQLVAEGKTKKIIAAGEDKVLIESKPDITAGDGARKDVLEGKEALANQTACNVFKLLNTQGIHTHFIQQWDEKTFLAKRAQMIPIELVARRIAAGSYLKRHPGTKEGTVFQKLVLEAFFKADDLHDPYIIFDERKNKFELFSSQKPVCQQSYLLDFPLYRIEKPFGSVFNIEDMDRLKKITQEVFSILEAAWEGLGVVLVDLKIECGWTKSGFLVVADVIDNDSWHIRPGNNYAWVAEATQKFI